MSPDTLLRHFEEISEAPDAVPRLRQFGYSLAIRGKLVARNPRADDCVGTLLAQIRRGRAAAQNGDTKTHRKRQCQGGVLPFDVPTHWAMVPINEIGSLCGGMTPSMDRAEFWGGSINWFSPKDIKSDELFGSELRVTSKAVTDTKLQVYPPGCLLMVARSGILKRVFPVAINRVEAAVNQDIKVLKPFVAGLERFLQIALKGMSDFILATLVKTGTTVQSFKYDEFQQQLIPLPPLAEQSRIIAKIDELMALCDELQEAQRNREHRRDRLVATTLHGLSNDAATNGTRSLSFEENARFYFDNLPRLATSPKHVRQLRASILNIALQGKLVLQDSNSRRTVHPELGGGVSIPNSWELRRLEELTLQITDGEHATPPRIAKHEIPLVTAKNVRDGYMDFAVTDWVSHETAKKAWGRCRPTPGDILMVCVGATTGRLCVLHEDTEFVLVRSVALIRPIDDICVDFLALALRSPMCQTQIWQKVKVAAQPCLYINRIKSLTIPLPSIAEQRRIVAKVDELAFLCDRLEIQINSATSNRRSLLEATLREALAPASTTAAVALNA